MLTLKGWISTIIIAGLIFLAGLGNLIIYPILFLILGSVVSKLNPANNDNSGRNHIQVIANAGVAAILSVFYLFCNTHIFIDAFVLSFATALSDTFSSEIGKRYGTSTIDIITFQRMKKGLSGGISIAGTLGGIFGSGFIATIHYYHFSDSSTSIAIFVWGFIGMIIDSILGSRIQAKYLIDNSIQEKGHRQQLIKGFHFIDNNAVNLISIFISVVLFCFWSLILN